MKCTKLDNTVIKYQISNFVYFDPGFGCCTLQTWSKHTFLNVLRQIAIKEKIKHEFGSKILQYLSPLTQSPIHLQSTLLIRLNLMLVKQLLMLMVYTMVKTDWLCKIETLCWQLMLKIVCLILKTRNVKVLIESLCVFCLILVKPSYPHGTPLQLFLLWHYHNKLGLYSFNYPQLKGMSSCYIRHCGWLWLRGHIVTLRLILIKLYVCHCLWLAITFSQRTRAYVVFDA